MRSVGSIITSLLKSGAIAVACLAVVDAPAAEPACSPDAEQSVGRIQGWIQLQDHFHRYGLGRCDDGELSAAYSDRVDILLTKKWKDVSTLTFLVKSDPEFIRRREEILSLIQNVRR